MSRKRRRPDIRTVIIRVLQLFGVYALVCVLLIPLFHREADEEAAAQVVQEVFGNDDTAETDESDSSISDGATSDSAYSSDANAEKNGDDISINSSDSQVGQSQERILCIDDNVDALIWRLRVIEEAEEEIILTTFDFWDDESGRDIMSALYAAAERGVHVKILIDGLKGEFKIEDSDFFQTLIAHENVEAKFYNPFQLTNLWTVNYRMHDKYLIADDEVYILGGRNTNNLFLGDYVERTNMDRDMLVYEAGEEQGTLAELKAYFDEIWEQSCNETLNGSADTETCSELLEHYASLKERYPEAFMETDWEGATIACDKIILLTGETEAFNKTPQIWETICALMEESEEIIIQTPYVVCGWEMYADLTSLCDAGKSIEIITNAVENGANPFGCVDYLSQKNEILDTGVSVYEWIGDQSMHAKTILLDDNISIVGSFNLDMRAVYLDTEMMLVIVSSELNAQLREQMDELKEASCHVLPDGEEEYGAVYEEIEMGTGKKIFYTGLRVITRLFRHLL
ncbi:MAG: phospholipase D family protein [Lachnospiraceae bacterium]|nr:phospholipase D family protein [Lachnospiraceae bacterium]